MTHIIKLDLSKNLLKELPEDFGEMKQLKHLDLYSNQVTHLPLSFCELKGLRWLDLKNNPLVPAVAKVVGPCLDAQQCQQSARAIVVFLTEMKQQIEEERERLRVQELKQLEHQQEKEKQQKKKNERKKAAKAKRKEIKKENVEDTKEIERLEKILNHGISSKNPVEPLIKTKNKKKSSNMLLLLFLMTPTFLFLLSASNALGPKTNIYRTQFINVWNIASQKLPESVQPWANYVAIKVENLHTLAGYHLDNLSVYLSDINESEQFQNIKGTLVETWHVTYNKSSVIFSTFRERLYVVSDQIKNMIF